MYNSRKCLQDPGPLPTPLAEEPQRAERIAGERRERGTNRPPPMEAKVGVDTGTFGVESARRCLSGSWLYYTIRLCENQAVFSAMQIVDAFGVVSAVGDSVGNGVVGDGIGTGAGTGVVGASVGKGVGEPPAVAVIWAESTNATWFVSATRQSSGTSGRDAN